MSCILQSVRVVLYPRHTVLIERLLSGRSVEFFNSFKQRREMKEKASSFVNEFERRPFSIVQNVKAREYYLVKYKKIGHKYRTIPGSKI